jgi:hypothetical protein
MPPVDSLSRKWTLLRYPKARIHRLEDGRAQVINPTERGLFEALSNPVGSRYRLRQSAEAAWRNAWQRISKPEDNSEEA